MKPTPNPQPRSKRPWTAAGTKSPVLTVDVVIQLDDDSVVLVRRRNAPFQGWWALPGGVCEQGETIENAALREAEEETGLQIDLVRLIGVFSDPGRDPRGHTVSVAFLARPIGGQLQAGSDAQQVQAFHQIPEEMAFDHDKILAEAGLLGPRGPQKTTRK